MADDLADAVFEALRLNPGLCQAFGDTWLSSLTFAQNTAAGNVSKFWGDYAAEVSVPQLVEFEPGETYTNMTSTGATRSYYADGQIQLAVLATPRSLARELGEMVIDTLDDQPIAWPQTQLMLLRVTGAAFVPQRGIGPQISSVFQRVLTFAYEYSGKRTFILPTNLGVP